MTAVVKQKDIYHQVVPQPLQNDTGANHCVYSAAGDFNSVSCASLLDDFNIAERPAGFAGHTLDSDAHRLGQLYETAFSFGMWGRWAMNSIVITLVSVMGMVLSCSMVAYSFARLRWPGRDPVQVGTGNDDAAGSRDAYSAVYYLSRLPAFGFPGVEFMGEYVSAVDRAANSGR